MKTPRFYTGPNRAALAAQIAATTGLEVVSGSARSVLPADQRDQFRV